MTAEAPTASGGSVGLRAELEEFWRGMPDKGLFLLLLAAWVALFHFLGNSTFGYTKTGSLFGWLHYCYQTPDDSHGLFIPFVVLVLAWFKRTELLAAPKRPWWPALLLLVLALLLHWAGFMVEQTRLSVVGFFVGLYAIMGVVWGPGLLRASFFPFFLFAFCVPMSSAIDGLTFHLRLVATTITSVICHTVLGIPVIQDGTRIFNPNGAYQYEVAAACSGIRSLTAIFALTAVYGFMTFKSLWRTWLVMASAFPVAVASNVLRLCMIIIVSETFSPEAGHYVHESSWISILPYVPAIIGVFVLGHWLREDKRPRQPLAQPFISGAPQNL